MLIFKKDLKKVERILEEFQLSGKNIDHIYKVFGEDNIKIMDIGVLESENKNFVCYGKLIKTIFPKELFNEPKKVEIDGIKFNVAPNELLKTWGKYSKKDEDKEYSSSLKTNDKLMKRIKQKTR